jgi:hypothetical protein
MTIRPGFKWNAWLIGIAWGKSWSGSGPYERCWRHVSLELLPLKFYVRLWQIR